MRRNKVLFIFLAIALLVFFVGLMFKSLSHKEVEKRENNVSTKEGRENTVILEDREIFFNAIKKFTKQKGEKNIFAAFSPHHLLASDLIARIFSIALGHQPETVIIIGPNHDNVGNSFFTSSDFSWNTDIGVLEPDLELLDLLISENLISLDNEILKKDHACYNLLPFIKFYSPDTKVVPILVNSKVDLDSLNRFVGFLKLNIDENTLIVSSIDFSHYLDAETAKRMDKETITALTNKEIYTIYKMRDTNIDCPSCAILPLLFSDLVGGKIEIIDNTNSGLLFDSYSVETTSYITAIFQKE